MLRESLLTSASLSGASVLFFSFLLLRMFARYGCSAFAHC